MAHVNSNDDLLSPQLATLASHPPHGEGWIHEIKFDGYRTIAELRKGRVRLITRNGHDWTEKYEVVADALEKSKIQDATLDGEVVWVDDNGKTDFQKLQNALKFGKSDRLAYFVFDVLSYKGRDLRDEPLAKRKKILDKLLSRKVGDVLRVSESWEEDSEHLLSASCKLGLEGIISKKIDAGYEPGRNKNWIKSKCTKAQEFVIGGYLKSEARFGFRSLLLGTYLPSGDFQYCGRVGTGFTQASIVDLVEKFRPLVQGESPFDLKSPPGRDCVWLKPELVAQVEFTEWTSEGSLRHPSFQGLREDKPSRDVHPDGQKSKRRSRPISTH